MNKIKLHLDTPEAKERWELIKKASQEVKGWPDWKRVEIYGSYEKMQEWESKYGK